MESSRRNRYEMISEITDVICKILSRKCYQEKIDKEFRNAISAGDEREVLRLLKKGADVKKEDSLGYACIHQAILSGHSHLIKYLVQNGADVEHVGNFQGYKPIHLCVYPVNKERSLSELLKYGARLDSVDCLRNNLLHLVVMHTPQNMAYIRNLLDYGLDPSAKNVINNNCLHIVSSSHSCSPKEAYYLGKLFVKRGVDIESVNLASAETPLQMAARTGKTALVDFLLREGAVMEVKNRMGLTPFEKLFSDDYIMMDIMNTFIMHIALRKHRGERIDESVFQRIASYPELQKIYHDYDENLNRLKTVQIVETHWVTMHDILCRKNKDVVKYLSLPYIRNNILRQDVITPYWKDIRHKVWENLYVAKFQQESFRVVDEILHDKLPYLCIKKISEYLSEKDVIELSVLLKNDLH